MSKKALITGILGQDGSYLAEFLLDKGYKVYGMARRTSHKPEIRDDLEDKVTILEGDMTDTASIENIIKKVKPDELYNLAAQSYVGASFSAPESTTDINAVGVLRILEAVRKYSPKTKVYQASTSEMFGHVAETPQNENTPFNPRSPYGLSKVYAHYAVKYYRESFNIFACCGILFNHESPRRGEEFVTMKIAKAAADIKNGKKKKLKMGPLEPKRDWGFAGDYVEAMWMILQQKWAEDYVIATGETHSVQEFVEAAFGYLGLDWKKYYELDKRFVRPAEVNLLLGDYKKARLVLGWKPKTKFKELVEMMVESQL